MTTLIKLVYKSSQHQAPWPTIKLASVSPCPNDSIEHLSISFAFWSLSTLVEHSLRYQLSINFSLSLSL